MLFCYLPRQLRSQDGTRSHKRRAKGKPRGRKKGRKEGRKDRQTNSRTLDPSQYLLMQPMQKLWPHGVDDGLLNTSRQIEHWNCSSDRKLPCKDILRTARQRKTYTVESTLTTIIEQEAAVYLNNLLKEHS